MAKEVVVLKCSECKRHNYTVLKEKKGVVNKLKLKKFCRFDNRHTLHTELK